MNEASKLEAKELLIKLRDHIETEDGFCGMCGSIMEMYDYAKEIDAKGCDILRNYLNDNEPKRKFRGNHLYWWKAGNKKPRINWLNREIVKLSLNF